jgi:hypothetical protein
MENLSLVQVKEQLVKLGMSTSTPGLTGDERHEELRSRLENYNKMKNVSIISADNSSRLADLSIGEIRSRLSMMGVSTNTAGFVGEQRREELLQRLINTICGDDAGNGMLEDIQRNKETEVTSGLLCSVLLFL